MPIPQHDSAIDVNLIKDLKQAVIGPLNGAGGWEKKIQVSNSLTRCKNLAGPNDKGGRRFF
jgi:hypothetical protein